jgi:SNF2 family DNA or RNA helicase
MKYQWGYQIAKFSDLNYIVVSGSQKERKKLYKKNMNFIILNYELLWRDIEFIKDIEWDIIVADEIQRIRNYKSDTFKCFLELKSERRIGLTGTPIENELMDLFTIMRFINPKILGPNAMSFRDRYCTFDYFGRIDPKKYKNLDEINKKLSFIMMRRKKRDVLDQLPDKTINNIYITLNDVEKKKYKEIKEGILEDMESGVLKSVGALSQIIYLRQVCDALNLVDSSKKDEVVSSKFEELKNIIRDLPEDSKIVIFTQYERMAKLIEDNIGYKSVHLHGGVKSDCKFEKETEERIRVEHADMSVKDLDIKVYEEKKKCSCVGCPYYNDAKKCHTRKKIMAKFDNDKDIKLFISTDAGKAGLDLQKANILINYDLSFNPATNEQRIARIERMGQLSNKILIINMVCYDTIEERVMKIIEMKQKLFDKVIDGMTEEEVEKVVFNNASVKDLL